MFVLQPNINDVHFISVQRKQYLTSVPKTKHQMHRPDVKKLHKHVCFRIAPTNASRAWRELLVDGILLPLPAMYGLIPGGDPAGQ